MKRAEYIATIAADIKRQRLALGFSQGDLAAAIGVSPSAVAGWEKGAGVLSAYSHALLKGYFKKQWAARQAAIDAGKSSPARAAAGKPVTA
jgi:transcriptional regulator with XRE-family HTH domain